MAKQRDCREGRKEATHYPVFSGLSSVKLSLLHARPGWGDSQMGAGRSGLSSRSEPLVHWERLQNKRTRIQIRKAQGWGCRGNLQQAPAWHSASLGWALRRARAGCPHL